MTKITVVLRPELEAKLRERIKRKGDLSGIVNDALRRYFEEVEADE